MKKTITVHFFKENKTGAVSDKRYKIERYIKYYNELHSHIPGMQISLDDIEEIREKKEIEIETN